MCTVLGLPVAIDAGIPILNLPVLLSIRGQLYEAWISTVIEVIHCIEFV